MGLETSELLVRLLEGKLAPGKVTLIYGCGGADKTNIAIICAISYANRGKTVLYFDAEGSFSRMRLDQTLKDYPLAGHHIFLTRARTFKEQGKFIRGLDAYVTKNVDLIVFDSINFLYRVDLESFSNVTYNLNREINFQMAFLKNLALDHNVCVLITSQVRQSMKTEKVEPVAADILTRWSDVIVSLTPNEAKQETVATLEKPSGDHISKPFKWLKYRLWLKENIQDRS